MLDNKIIHKFCYEVNVYTISVSRINTTIHMYLLNLLDYNYKITINNKNKNMEELRDKVLIEERNDDFNNYRRIYNEIIEGEIIEGRQGIEQERYLTITIERKNFEEAKAQFIG